VWIETESGACDGARDCNSPVSNDGCGLKRFGELQEEIGEAIHPSAMTGVD